MIESLESVTGEKNGDTNEKYYIHINLGDDCLPDTKETSECTSLNEKKTELEPMRIDINLGAESHPKITDDDSRCTSLYAKKTELEPMRIDINLGTESHSEITDDHSGCTSLYVKKTELEPIQIDINLGAESHPGSTEESSKDSILHGAGTPTNTVGQSKQANQVAKESSPDKNVDSSSRQMSAKSNKNFEFDVYTRLLNRYQFKCCNGEMYVYNTDTGCFQELNDNKLKILIRRGWPQEIERFLSKNKVDEIIDRLRTSEEIQVSDEEFDRYSDLINFKDCVLDVTTGKVHPHSPKYCFRSFIDANYKLQHSNGITFRNLIEQVSNGDREKIKLLQEIFGYVISNYTTAKKWFTFIGKPHSGKSTLLEIMKEIIGTEYTSAIPLHKLHERFMKAELYQKKLNISGELNEGELKDLDTLKAITGNDYLVAEKKGQDPFTFVCKAKLVFAGNQMPMLHRLDSTSAFMDRIVFVVFNFTIPEKERDFKLKDKILAERDFIVKWGMEGLKRLVNNNFNFTECQDSLKFRREYIKDTNNVADFVETMCLLDQYDQMIRVHKRDIYQAYLDFCKDNCFKVLKKEEFFNEIRKYPVKADKFRYRKSNPLEGFIGITLRAHFFGGE